MKKPLIEVDLKQSFAAQPIFDSSKKRFALELVHRSKTAVTPLQLEPTAADQLAQLCHQINDYIAPYRAPLLLRVSPALLLSAPVIPLAPEQVIITLAPSSSPSAELPGALSRYKKQGFRIALLDADFSQAGLALIALADIIKFDAASCVLADIERHKAQYQRPGLRWLAENIETEQQFTLWKALGCELFQGYFLADELKVAGRKIEPGAIKLAEIISCLFVDEPDINKLATLLQDEPAIVMGMLKIANSPLYRKTRAVGTVKEMVMRLGLELSRKWVLTYAVLSSTTAAAAITVLSRAHTAQSIAERWQLDAGQGQQYFLAALISGTDILFGINSAKFLPHLNLNNTIRQALQHNSGRMAEALDIIRSIERGYALKQPATVAELPYLNCYNSALADVQLRLAEAGA